MSTLVTAEFFALPGRGDDVADLLLDYTDHLAWRTERGFTDTFEAMLTQPLVIHYYDQVYYGQGIAAPSPA